MSKLVNGLYFSRPKEGAPEFVKGKISIKVSDFDAWYNIILGDPEKYGVSTDKNGQQWINIDMLLSKKNEIYFSLNDWKPQPK